MLFICLARAGFYDAYVHRIASLRAGLESLGVNTVMLYLGDMPLKKPFLISPLNVPLLRKYFDGFDYVHAGNTGAAYLMDIAKTAARTDSKVIYDVHGNLAEEAKLNYRGGLDFKNGFHYIQYTIMEKIASKYSDYFAVCSESFRDHYLNRGVHSNRIEVVLNGVNIDLFKPRGPPENDVFTVTYAGRSQKWQGVGLLLQAARLLKDEEVRFRVIGMDSATCRELQGKYGNVEFMDFIPDTSLVDHLCGSDALIIPRMSHPALEVAFPTKFAEYIACGVPVIVTDIGDAGRLTRRHGCGLACATDAGSIAAAILKLKNTDKEERQAMGNNGRRLAEEMLDYKKISRTYYDFLNKVSS
ncbi:MAG: glycosyltransferase family 4 protein [Betaproteobacteria bacterium]